MFGLASRVEEGSFASRWGLLSLGSPRLGRDTTLGGFEEGAADEVEAVDAKVATSVIAVDLGWLGRRVIPEMPRPVGTVRLGGM